nr:MAG TPA: hypothetical protein [Caudoviricetes sp.]
MKATVKKRSCKKNSPNKKRLHSDRKVGMQSFL